MLSQAEENYLKTLFNLVNEREKKEAGTNELADLLGVKPATVNGMLKKLKEKDFVSYEKYGKISLTKKGEETAIKVVRKHRLWETFLFDKLGFGWEEVHEVAEQLEHIRSNKLIEKLEEFLAFPKTDPHGDPIPDLKGEFNRIQPGTLDSIEAGKTCKLIKVKDNSTLFLQYATRVGLELEVLIKVISREPFDGSLQIEVKGKKCRVSKKFAKNLYVEAALKE